MIEKNKYFHSSFAQKVVILFRSNSTNKTHLETGKENKTKLLE